MKYAFMIMHACSLDCLAIISTKRWHSSWKSSSGRLSNRPVYFAWRSVIVSSMLPSLTRDWIPTW